MFVKRKRSLLTQKFKYENSNIAFCCMKPFEGFEVGRIYKPFAYTAEFTTYTDFALFDHNGEVFYMEDKLIRTGIFKVMLHGNLYINKFAQEEDEAIKFIEYENHYWKKAQLTEKALAR